MKFLSRHSSLSACLLFLCACLIFVVGSRDWKERKLFHWDIAGYYIYLPAVFIYDDATHFSFYDHIEEQYQPSPGVKRYAIFEHPDTKRSYVKYTTGVAVFEAPLFLIAHLYAVQRNPYAADGYSPPYQLAVYFSSLLFAFLGLLVLRRFLLYYFKDPVVALVLMILGLGTNLWVYSVIDPGMSHVYLFFLYAVTLLYTKRFLERPTIKSSIVLGLALGMAIMIRPTDVFLVFLPLLWGITSFSAIRERLYFLWKGKGYLLLAVVAAMIPLGVQMAVWCYTTGHLVWFSYTGEYFTWNDCHLWEGLFSYKKGWFVYTPLALLGFLGAFVMLRKRELGFYLLPFAAYYAASFYVLFCWVNWWYGGSFGCRALLQSLTLLALPMGYFVQYCFKGARWKRLLLLTVIFAGIGLNQFQSLQYKYYTIVDQEMNRPYYWRVFFKLNVTEKDRELYKNPPSI